MLKILTILAGFAFAITVESDTLMYQSPEVQAQGQVHTEKETEISSGYDFEHERETYLSALEWCESRGKHGAVNAVDLDGTASWWWFQFKPGTFLSFGLKYGLLPAGTTPGGILEGYMRDYRLTREIVRRMAYDPEVDMGGQFPGCTRKLGYPPKQSYPQ